MILWQAKWIRDNNLASNIFAVTSLTLAPGYVHTSNFTIPLAELAWLLLTVALLFAGLCRRRNWELFQYTHFFAGLFFFGIAILHAWAHWYYAAGGLLLWAWDKVIRTINAAREVEVVSITHAAGISRVVVRASVFKRGYAAGQFAYVHTSALGPLQWHPFTISSSPPSAAADGVATFHIRAMGRGTWTSRLADLALALGSSKELTLADVPLSIDGPYGRAGHYYERDTVVLVAGGIGVTPIASILGDLYARATQPDVYGPPGNVRRVHLIWTVRDPNLLTVFADLLADIVRNNANGMFQLHLHCTEAGQAGRFSESAPETPYGMDEALLIDESRAASAEEEAEHPGKGIRPADAGWCTAHNATAVLRLATSGRAHLPTLFEDIARDAKADISASGVPHLSMNAVVSVFACGPEALLADASDTAFAHGFDFHSEVFNY
jgi:NAD(P)H-flavin reductase